MVSQEEGVGKKKRKKRPRKRKGRGKGQKLRRRCAQRKAKMPPWHKKARAETWEQSAMSMKKTRRGGKRNHWRREDARLS